MNSEKIKHVLKSTSIRGNEDATKLYSKWLYDHLYFSLQGSTWDLTYFSQLFSWLPNKPMIIQVVGITVSEYH